jgi:hypothetical protein
MMAFFLRRTGRPRNPHTHTDTDDEHNGAGGSLDVIDLAGNVVTANRKPYQ